MKKVEEMMNFGYVYIMTNKNRTTLYIGVTNDLVRRVYEHKKRLVKNSFTDRYNLEYCVYYEEFVYFDAAISREKELKKWNRQKKEVLINQKNPEWKELVNKRGFIRDKSCLTSLDMTGEGLRFLTSFGMTGECLEWGEGADTAAASIRKTETTVAAVSAPSFFSRRAVIPNGTQWNEESHDFNCNSDMFPYKK